MGKFAEPVVVVQRQPEETPPPVLAQQSELAESVARAFRICFAQIPQLCTGLVEEGQEELVQDLVEQMEVKEMGTTLLVVLASTESMKPAAAEVPAVSVATEESRRVKVDPE
jgi:hypothetical protein